MSVRHLLEWRVVLHPERNLDATTLPTRILTPALSHASASLPLEVAILLPTGAAADLEPMLKCAASTPATTAIGLFTANPFLNISQISRRLRADGVTWLCNLPSSTQHDDRFLEQLDDVGLGANRECQILEKFRSLGFRTLMAVSRPEEAKAAVATGATALFVLPRVGQFETGFPSARVREELVDLVRAAVPDWPGAILGFAALAEETKRSVWPKTAGGVVLRPQILK
ncbi:MAG: hypothetical protein ACR2RF_27165 [Geminicoccaceae bacterium]